MKTIIIVNDNEKYLLSYAKELLECGVKEIKTFNTIDDALFYMDMNYFRKVILFLDLLLFSNDKTILDKLDELTNHKGEIEIYFMTILIQPINSKLLSSNKNYKGFVQKPLTVEIVKGLLDKQ